MNANCYSRIGKTHKICQDYAVTQVNEDIAFAIISDGCSASKDTDCGARLLARVCAHKLSEIDSFSLAGPIALIEAAAAKAKDLLLDYTSVDATLCYIKANKETYSLKMYGDGVVVKVLDSGDMEVTHVEFPSNAPRYLGYGLDEDRYQMYLDVFGNEIKYRSFLLRKTGEVDCEKLELTQLPAPIMVSYSEDSICKYSDIIILSDGIVSFTKDGQMIKLEDVLKELLPFKNFNGEFVERRALRFMKDAEKLGWAHNDDFSMAAIHFGD